MPPASKQFPVWLHRPFSVHGQWNEAKSLVRDLKLHTVCEEARCPNLGECWSHGNVSFMILGRRCTRRCGFCAVETARPDLVDSEEPRRLAEAVAALKLKYVVVTSVARDDLPDEGAGAFAASLRAIRARAPEAQVEVLTPDFHARGELIGTVLQERPAVYNHNVETVPRLSPRIRPQAGYARSLSALRIAKEMGRHPLKTKSGLMVGLGETPGEVRQTMIDLRGAGVDLLTVGQYLRPTEGHHPVSEFVLPEQFSIYERWGRELGFSFVASGPRVRSSYNAFEALQGGL
ncbi:MAG: lipoyl synthase [Candidatus Omnitrophica bacterium]|nr:lipoyl synthase [Candidatus Omnitrophota bacterium]